VSTTALSTPVKGVPLHAVTPASVTALLLRAPATSLVPKKPAPSVDQTLLAQWSPTAVAQSVPQAAAIAFTPQGIEAQLTPAAVTQTALYNLATAAVVAALM
jgi:hypothetical protein